MKEFTVQLFDDGSAQIGGTGANLELRFGYSKNAHMYSVKFIRSKEWEDLYIRVHFHPEADIYDVEPVLAQNNIVNIPAVITSMPGKGKLTIEGTDGYKTITSADIPYRVSENSGIDSETDPEPGESSFQQFVDAVKEDAKSAEQAAKDAESALAETKEAASLALSDIETARTNAISDIEKIESEVKGEIQEDVDSAESSAEAASKSAEEAKSAADSAKKSLSDLETAKESALTSIDSAKQGAVKAVEDKASEESSAIDEKAAQVIQSVQNAGDAEISAIGKATTSGIEQITQSAGQHLTRIDSAADDAVQDIMDVKEDSLDEFEAVNAHPPIQNPETGKWQVYSAETSSYVDTKYDWEGGYYSPSVDSEGNLTWQASKEGMDDIPSSNIRGPQGLGVPTSTANDYGKAPTVDAAGTGYELTGPYAPLSAAITETAKGNPVNITDSVEWSLLGLKVYGKSTQASTTGANLANPNGITTSSNFIILYEQTPLEIAPGESYSFAIYIDDQQVNVTQIELRENGSDALIKVEYTNSLSYTNDGESSHHAYFRAYFVNGLLPTSYRIMLNAGSTMLPFEPYTGGKPSPSPEYPQEIVSAGDEGEISITLSDSGEQSQSLTLSTPNGLPGIPVDSGGNYTDAEGQQWVCDAVDFARGVYVQRLFSISGLNASNYVDNDTCRQVFIVMPHQGKNTTGLSNRFVYKDAQSPGLFSADNLSPAIYVRFELDTSLEQINQILQDSIFIYELAAPIETPLPEEELAAYRALHTYDGTTVVTPDDALAEVEVDYIVKPKAYIEKKLTAIETRLNALEISEALEGE